MVLAASLIVTGCEQVEPVPFPTTPTNPQGSTKPSSIVLTASSGFNQQLEVTAKVLSADGHAIPNVAVMFGIGAGSIAPTTVTTDAGGTARALAISTASTTIAATIGGGIVSTVDVLPSQP